MHRQTKPYLITSGAALTAGVHQVPLVGQKGYFASPTEVPCTPTLAQLPFTVAALRGNVSLLFSSLHTSDALQEALPLSTACFVPFTCSIFLR